MRFNMARALSSAVPRGNCFFLGVLVLTIRGTAIIAINEKVRIVSTSIDFRFPAAERTRFEFVHLNPFPIEFIESLNDDIGRNRPEVAHADVVGHGRDLHAVHRF